MRKTKLSGRVYDFRDAMALDDARNAEGKSRLTSPYYSDARTETRSLREMVAAFVATDVDGDLVLDKAAHERLVYYRIPEFREFACKFNKKIILC